MNFPHKPLRSAVGLLGAMLLAHAHAHAQPAQSAIQLAPGVLVEAADEAPLAWVADARGRVAAIALADGAVIWRAAVEGLPLAVIDGKLVVMGRPDRSGQLSLHLLDPQTGATRGGLLGELPEGVLAAPDPQPNRRFEALADTRDGRLKIRWSYQEWPLRGTAMPERSDSAPRHMDGAVSVDFAADRIRAIDAAAMPAPRSADLSGDERLAQLDGTQFLGADDATVQVASAVADESLGTQWCWSLHERASGRRIGSLTLPHAHAPFLLRGRQLLWRSEALTRLQASGSYLELPARLIAQDLGDGRELWSMELLDQQFRAAPPP